jgi:hypothetical protein
VLEVSKGVVEIVITNSKDVTRSIIPSF